MQQSRSPSGRPEHANDHTAYSRIKQARQLRMFTVANCVTWRAARSKRQKELLPVEIGWLHFHIVTPRPIGMREGALIDYHLRVRGIPLRWRTRINVWQPPHRFVDEQVRGPYRQWIHEHTFEPREGGTLARDRVRYAVPLDVLVHQWLVRPDLEKIFQFRTDALRRRFSTSPARQQ